MSAIHANVRVSLWVSVIFIVAQRAPVGKPVRHDRRIATYWHVKPNRQPPRFAMWTKKANALLRIGWRIKICAPSRLQLSKPHRLSRLWLSSQRLLLSNHVLVDKLSLKSSNGVWVGEDGLRVVLSFIAWSTGFALNDERSFPVCAEIR